MSDLIDQLERMRAAMMAEHETHMSGVRRLDAEHQARNSDFLAAVDQLGWDIERRQLRAIEALQQLAELMRLEPPRRVDPPIPRASPPPLPPINAARGPLQHAMAAADRFVRTG